MKPFQKVSLETRRRGPSLWWRSCREAWPSVFRTGVRRPKACCLKVPLFRCQLRAPLQVSTTDPPLSDPDRGGLWLTPGGFPVRTCKIAQAFPPYGRQSRRPTRPATGPASQTNQVASHRPRPAFSHRKTFGPGVSFPQRHACVTPRQQSGPGSRHCGLRRQPAGQSPPRQKCKQSSSSTRP